MGMTWDELRTEVEDQLARLEARDVGHFVVAAWPGRVDVHAEGDGLELHAGQVRITDEVPPAVLDRLGDVDGWERDTTLLVPGPFAHGAVADLVLHGLREGWQADPEEWAYVGSDSGYGRAVKDAPDQ